METSDVDKVARLRRGSDGLEEEEEEEMDPPAPGSSDCRGGPHHFGERLNTRRGECHCFGDLQGALSMYSAAGGLARTDRQSGAGRFKFHAVEDLARPLAYHGLIYSTVGAAAPCFLAGRNKATCSTSAT
ncbi:unnamed protein product [Arctogadus glacialis]